MKSYSKSLQEYIDNELIDEMVKEAKMIKLKSGKFKKNKKVLDK